MRKVTASAVILTALTGCGQNSGIPSTQWSFEIPSEDQISSLELGQETGVADATFVSAVNSQVRSYDAADSFDTESGASLTAGMMGPAFNQPSDELGTATSSLSESGDSALSLSNTGNYGSLASAGRSTGSYQPVAVRPDPVAQVKAFLSANGSPSALVNREPYRSEVMTPALPAVYLPTPASITATLGDPTGIESQVAFVDDGSFTSVGLPVIESSPGGIYSTASDYSADYSAGAEVAAVSANAYPIGALSDASPAQPLLTANNGLPMLGPSSAGNTSIGTAILRDLQATQTQTTQAQADPVAQSASALPVQANVSGGIDIAIIPAEVAESNNDLVASAWDASPVVEPSATTDAPTLESLTRSMVVREVSPLVAYASQTGETGLAVEAIALSTPHTDFPTLESLLDTMPDTAAQPNFAIEPENNAASPLLEGLSSSEPLSTLYIPIPDAVSASSANANLSTNVSLIRGSLASLADILPAASASQESLDGALVSTASQIKTNLQRRSSDAVLQQRNRAILSLVDKASAKRRQLVAY